MKFRFFAGLLLASALVCFSACSTSHSSPSGTGELFVTTQGDHLVTPFSVNLGSGALGGNGAAVPTGANPSAALVAPSGNVLFVANSGANPGSDSNQGTISIYTVNADGTLKAAGTQNPGTDANDMKTPKALAMDFAGKFLFVANQGVQVDPLSGTISVFTVNGTTLTETGTFSTNTTGAATSTGPSAVAVTPDGQFLYVANQFDVANQLGATVTKFSVDPTSGAISQPIVYPVGTAPSALAFQTTTASGATPAANFLYVANAGSNNISAFAVCDSVSATCLVPDGSLKAVTNSPFPAPLGPVSIATTASGKFLYVVDSQSNQVSEFTISAGTGVLTANSQATISTGNTPVWAAFRAGTTALTATGGTKDFLYVANSGSDSISVYQFDSTIGNLSLAGPPVTTGGQPSAIAAK